MKLQGRAVPNVIQPETLSGMHHYAWPEGGDRVIYNSPPFGNHEPAFLTRTRVANIQSTGPVNAIALLTVQRPSWVTNVLSRSSNRPFYPRFLLRFPRTRHAKITLGGLEDTGEPTPQFLGERNVERFFYQATLGVEKCVREASIRPVAWQRYC